VWEFVGEHRGVTATSGEHCWVLPQCQVYIIAGALQGSRVALLLDCCHVMLKSAVSGHAGTSGRHTEPSERVLRRWYPLTCSSCTAAAAQGVSRPSCQGAPKKPKPMTLCVQHSSATCPRRRRRSRRASGPGAGRGASSCACEGGRPGSATISGAFSASKRRAPLDAVPASAGWHGAVTKCAGGSVIQAHTCARRRSNLLNDDNRVHQQAKCE